MKVATHRVIAWAWNGLFLALLLALVAGIAFLRLSPNAPSQMAGAAAGHVSAGMNVPAGFMRGPSGALLPRFASLAHTPVQVRMGPGASYPVAWVVRGGRMPVEVVAESGNWLRIRDHAGEEGWVARHDLSEERLALIAPWRRDVRLALHTRPAADAPLAAWLMPGVTARVIRCDGRWCRIRVPQANISGWVGQEQLWGVYAGERFAPHREDAATKVQ